jgi:hypothetical protein
MKFVLFSLILLATIIGFASNFRKEAQKDWYAFEEKFNKPLSELLVDQPKMDPSTKTEYKVQNEVVDIVSNVDTDESENIEIVEAPYQPTSRDPLAFLSKEIQDSPLFEQLTNFNLDELDMLENKEIDQQALASLTQQVVLQLTQCIKEESCLEEMGEKYQDINEMRSIQLIERTLYIALALQDVDPASPAVSAMMIGDLLSVPSAPLHYVALEILGSQQLAESDFNSLMNLSVQLPVESKGHLFSRLEREAQTSPQRRSLYLQTMGAEITKNSETALEILKHLPFIDLSAQELTTISKSLCHYGAQDIDQRAQWEMIQFHHGQYNELKGHGIQLNSLCGR